MYIYTDRYCNRHEGKLLRNQSLEDPRQEDPETDMEALKGRCGSRDGSAEDAMANGERGTDDCTHQHPTT